MSDGQVILGGFVFRDYEIPKSISLGGKQSTKVQEMVGGQRTVDAMGPSPGDKTWTGRFRGGDALYRAQTIDAMRIAGAAVSLSWLGIFYLVVISEFKADTEKYYEIPYSITCIVVDDPTQNGGDGAASLDTLVGGDLSYANEYLPTTVATVSTALATLNTAISSAPQLSGAASSVIVPVYAATAAASAAISSSIAAIDPTLDTVSPDGSDPTVMAAWLANAGSNAVTQSGLADGFGYVSRIGLNLQLGAV